jgi:hypothetical protein
VVLIRLYQQCKLWPPVCVDGVDCVGGQHCVGWLQASIIPDSLADTVPSTAGVAVCVVTDIVDNSLCCY